MTPRAAKSILASFRILARQMDISAPLRESVLRLLDRSVKSIPIPLDQIAPSAGVVLGFDKGVPTSLLYYYAGSNKWLPGAMSRSTACTHGIPLSALEYKEKT